MEETVGVRSFIGIDAHSKNCSIKAIGNQGEVLLQVDVRTEKRELQRVLKKVERPALVMLESSMMAAFVKDCIEPVVDRVIACETRENRWISHNEHKSDQADADRLARLLRLGEYKEVYLPSGIMHARREVLLLYQKAQRDVVRTKNRIKGKYREHGVSVQGAKLYSSKHRDEYLNKIGSPHIRQSLALMYQKLDADELYMDELLNQLTSLLKDTVGYKLLKTIPGIGKIWSSLFTVLIGDPFRFEGKRQLWAYAGLGLCKPWSSDPRKGRVRGSKSGNRYMKHAAISAATCAIRGDNRFSRHYKEMLLNGVEPSMAKRTVARQILAVVLAILKSGEAYRELK